MRDWHDAEAELEVMMAAKQRGERFEGNLEEARMKAAEARFRAQGGHGAPSLAGRASGRTASGN